MTSSHEPQVKPIKYGVVPAGGLGTRFLPITRTVPKELLPIVDTAVIELVVSELAASGVERVVIVVGPGKESIESYFRPNPKIERRLQVEFRKDELELLRRPENVAQGRKAVHGYLLEPEIFEVLASAKPGVGGEIWLTDAISTLARQGGTVWAVELEGQRYDAGDKLGYVKAFLDAALGRVDTGAAAREHLK